MSRLTYKLKDGNYICGIIKGGFVNKLGELEDFEEEIDFPLDIAFRALKEGIYTEAGYPNKRLEKFDVRGIELKGLGVISKVCPYGECDFTCAYKDYKKTWWLKADKTE